SSWPLIADAAAPLGIIFLLPIIVFSLIADQDWFFDSEAIFLHAIGLQVSPLAGLALNRIRRLP
ncbi:MAG: hypothetical protein CBD47_06355, partial [Synechococcus sp. TMED187]